MLLSAHSSVKTRAHCPSYGNSNFCERRRKSPSAFWSNTLVDSMRSTIRISFISGCCHNCIRTEAEVGPVDVAARFPSRLSRLATLPPYIGTIGQKRCRVRRVTGKGGNPCSSGYSANLRSSSGNNLRTRRLLLLSEWST